MTASLVLDVAHSGLSVIDLDDASALWCSGLGFVLERTFTLDEDTTTATTGIHGAVISAATVTLGTQRVELLQYDPPRKAGSTGSHAQVGTVHMALTVSDLDRVLALGGSLEPIEPPQLPHRPLPMTDGLPDHLG